MSDKCHEILEILDPDYGEAFLTLEEYNQALLLVEDEEDKNLFCALKLTRLINFGGSMSFDSRDMLQVLAWIKEGMEQTAALLDLSLDYVHLMYCVLVANDIIEYGSSIRWCWITDKGKEVLNPEYTPEYRKMLDPEGIWGDHQIF